MNGIALSILMPAVVDRDSRALCLEITTTIKQEGLPFEFLVLTDNRQRSTGLKRQALMDMARGQYVMHLDDDDGLAPDALKQIADAMAHTDFTPEVISFDSEATIDGANPFRVRTRMDHENEQATTVNGQWVDIRRKPWHWCAWKRNFVEAAGARFPDGYIDEDAYWLRQLWSCDIDIGEYHINEVLHFYRYNSKTTLAQQGVPTVIVTEEQKQWEAEGCPPPPRDVDEGIL